MAFFNAKKKEAVQNDAIVSFVENEFERRKKERMPWELQWRLNSNFLLGNQYCDINLAAGKLYDIEKNYPWEQKEVFNHLSPIWETRLSKLTRVKPRVGVRPATEDNEDILAAKVSDQILKAAYGKIEMGEKVSEAVASSEMYGSVFYKNVWNKNGGQKIGEIEGKSVFEGELEVNVVSPYEIFPDSCYAKDMSEIKSIIHAKAVDVNDIKDAYGADINGQDVSVFSLSDTSKSVGGLGYLASMKTISSVVKKNAAVLIEYYEKPTSEYINGRFVVIAGKKLLYDGQLPFNIAEREKPGLPFVRQVCIEQPGCFFGISIIERCLPVQRAYNAVKNRKHEYLNRAAIGILEVEDGAVDTDDLQQEGLYPGKIILKMPGSAPIRFLENSALPPQFEREESRLLNEFELISGVSELSKDSSVPSGVTSGSALRQLREQDDIRMAITVQNIRSAVVACAKHWIRLYRQFASNVRIDRIIGYANLPKVLSWNKSQLNSDDIVFENGNEMNQSLEQKRELVFNILDRKLFHDQDTQKLSQEMKNRIFDWLELSDMGIDDGLTRLHTKKAERENISALRDIVPDAKEYDNHQLHISEHLRYLLSPDIEPKTKSGLEEILAEHINIHKQFLDKQRKEASINEKEQNN